MKNFNQVIKSLNLILSEQQPKTFSSSWILKNSPAVYRFIFKNIRTEVGSIDWDKVIRSISREFQPRWHPYRKNHHKIKLYRNKKELDVVLNAYRSKLYIFISALDEDDKKLRDEISIVLVRIAQKGNLSAQKQLVIFLKYLVNQWLEYCPKLFCWRGHNDELEARLIGCIRCYRFTGSFIGYMFKTLEYSGRGLRRLESYSLDGYIGESKSRLIDSVVRNSETGEIGMFNSSYDLEH
ncbi:MAG: hypothetical protein WC668_03205 [Patescibacteria group bacterium]